MQWLHDKLKAAGVEDAQIDEIVREVERQTGMPRRPAWRQVYDELMQAARGFAEDEAWDLTRDAAHAAREVVLVLGDRASVGGVETDDALARQAIELEVRANNEMAAAHLSALRSGA